jgi:phage protein D/phage baseplate assembly protein gpV
VPDPTRLLAQFYIKIGGSNVSEALMHNVLDVAVESSLHLPDMATIRVQDPDGKWVDDELIAPGQTLEIAAGVGGANGPLFDGEIVEIEASFIAGKRVVVVRGFDRLHRLARGKHVVTYLNVTDADVVQQIASKCGLSAKVGPAKEVYPYLLQDNITHLDFLRRRSAAIGYLLFVRGKELHCEPLGEATAVAEFRLDETLREFYPRLTTVDQVDEVSVRSWDPDQKQPVVGKASNGQSSPQIGVERQGGAVAKKAFSMPASVMVADRPIRTQTSADGLAQATLNRRLGRFVEAEGVAEGTPALTAGVSVKLQGVGKRFSGTYFVTSATHTYDPDDGYSTRFMVSGYQPATLLHLLAAEHDGAAAQREGLVTAIVTDNKDPQNLGRVKVKFPWLSNDHQSNWARLVAPGAGNGRGMQFTPEINDEVLVGFEHGNMDYPYVLGGLWNSKDPPPRKSDAIIASDGKVKERVIKSRTGHIVTIDDSDDKPSITIVDKTAKNTIKLESTSNKLTIHVEGDILLEAPQGDVGVKGKTVTMEATQGFKIKGLTVDTEATNGLKLKGQTTELEGTATVKAKGATVDVDASVKLGINGGAMLEAKGGVIKLN